MLASDADVDLAVIEADTGGIEPLEWSEEDVESLPIGRTVLALANPGGRGLRVTPGFVSSTARSFRGPRGRRIGFAIEHTAPLPRGSSGGPLIDRAGRLLGINSIRTDGGLILAVPGRSRHPRARGEAEPRRGAAARPAGRGDRAAAGRPPSSPRGRPARARRRPDPGGRAGSAADRAGLERGDLIVAVGERELDRMDVLYEALDAARPTGGSS